MNRGKHIAIVEDDDNIRDLMAENLRNAGYRVSAFFTAEQFERKAEGCDLLLLDIMLPGKNGLALLRDLRSGRGATFPVILISASEQEAHIDTALSQGAIDYIVKPFNMKHLLMKIENLFEQIASTRSGEKKDGYTLGAGRFDPELNVAIRDKKEFKLTPSEAATLLYFLQHPNRIITREELQEHISAHAKGVSSRNLDNYILKFRKLFEIDAKDPVLFVTIPRKGYALKR